MSAFAERALLTAIDAGLSPAVLGDALVAAGTERAYADTGHALDFINKACTRRLCCPLSSVKWSRPVAPRNRLLGASPPLQTSDIARRLMRGGELHQEEGASS
jgi:hypothetical protein